MEFFYIIYTFFAWIQLLWGPTINRHIRNYLIMNCLITEVLVYHLTVGTLRTTSYLDIVQVYLRVFLGLHLICLAGLHSAVSTESDSQIHRSQVQIPVRPHNFHGDCS